MTDDAAVARVSKARRRLAIRSVRFLRVIAGVSVTLLGMSPSIAGGTAMAASSGEQLVGDAQAVTLPSDYTPPSGLRQLLPLAGVAFVAPSISAGFYSHLDGTGGSYAPSQPGDELLYLSVEAYSFAPPFGQTPYHYAAPQLSVNFAGHTVALAETPDGSVSGVAGSAYGDDGAHFPGRWVVALPRGVPAQLVATEDGFSQTLDLRTGLRAGPSPAVLYRDQSGPLGLDLRPNLAGNLVVTAGGNRVTFPVSLREAALNFFNLQSPDATPGASSDQAYLFVEVSFGVGVDQAGHADWYFDPAVPSHAVSASVAGAGVATPTQGPPPPDPTDTSTLFKGLYSFVVPASATSVAVTVGAGTDPSVYYEGPDDLSPRAEPVSSSRPANFSVSFPAPAPATLSPLGSTISVPPSTVTSPVATQPVSLAGGSTSSRRANGAAGWTDVGAGAGAGAAVVVVIFGVVFISRRTKIVEARPVKPKGAEGDPGGEANASEGSPSEPVLESDSSLHDGLSDQASETAPVTSVEAPASAVSAVTLPRLRVRLIGPLEVEGLLGAIRRIRVLQILLVLCLNLGRPISSEELRNRLATSDDSEPSAPTVRSEMSRLRKVLPAGLLAERVPGSDCGLPPDDVEVDWFIFKALMAQSHAAEGTAKLELATKALRLVRGRVLEHHTWHGVDALVWDMNAEIGNFASAHAALALEMGRPAEAAEISRLALLAVPGSPGLWRLRMRAAQAGSGENFDHLAEMAKADTGNEVHLDEGDAEGSGAPAKA